MSDFFESYAINRNTEKAVFNLTVNQLPVNLLDFALISNMRHRAYGFVIHGSEDCVDDCCLNHLARQSLWRILFNIQQHLLGNQKIALNKMYIQEEHLLDPSQTTFFTNYASIESVNVIETLVSHATVTISPFTVLDVNLQQNGQYIEARFDSTKVPNPNKAMLRDSVTYQQFPWQHVAGYPKKDGTDWVMVVSDAMTYDYFIDPTSQVNLEDYEYVTVDMTNDSSLDITKIVALHPGTQQILPFAKAPERVVVSATTYIRLTFYVWTLGKIEFADTKYNIPDAEYYKLYTSLAIYKRVESESLADIFIDQSAYLGDCDTDADDIDQEVTDLAWLKLVDRKHGIVRYNEIYDRTGLIPPTYAVKTSGLPLGRRYKLRYYYKINPLLYTNLPDDSVEEVRRAIVAKTAATIELETCGCTCAANDYISKMQEEYTKQKADPLTGEVAVQYLYGHRRGDLLFAEVVKSIGQRQEGVVV